MTLASLQFSRWSAKLPTIDCQKGKMMKRTVALSFIACATAFHWTPVRGVSKHLSMSAAMSQDELKKLVGYKAVDDYVKSGMVVGLGTGSTAYFAVERVGQKIKSGQSSQRCSIIIYSLFSMLHNVAQCAHRLNYTTGELSDVVCIPTSERTKEQAISLGIPLCTLNEKSRLDVSNAIAQDHHSHYMISLNRFLLPTGCYRWC